MPGLAATPPSADRPPGSRLALVLATATYDDAALRRLRAPAQDAVDLAEILADPAIGGFTVTSAIDQPAQQVRLAIEDFVAERSTGDLLVVYLSCHGLLDDRRRLYFAATDTRKDRLGSTGVESAWVLDQLEHCRARRQVLILDSCFSGAFAHGAKGQADLGLRDRFLGHGRGRVVLTASTATEYSFEGELADPVSSPGSVFTAALVQGLRTGAADTDHDGRISVDDAYAYVFDQVQEAGAAQTPQRWLYGAEGQILLAHSPGGPILIPAPLPESLRAGLDSPHPSIRVGAVTQLAEWLISGDLARAASARQHLQEIADNDISRVAHIAQTFLDGDTAADPSVPADPHATIGTVDRDSPPQDSARATTSAGVAGMSRLIADTAQASPSESAPADADLLPSVDRRPTQRLRLPARTMRIGRAPDNDLVLADDFEASPRHAELRKSPAGYEIVDQGSRSGTFVNGKRVSRAVLSEQDIVGIGRSTFRLAASELRQFVDEGEVSFTAQDLVVHLPDGEVLLDHVSFPIPEKSLLGVIGPSGAGKSTLLAALTGIRPADTGTVLYDNRDLYRHYAELRYRIGLVPQENILHTQLTVRRALQYSAELRFPADTTAAERDSRIEEVLSELALTKQAETRADRLSGGQLKRVNVAQELLTKPSLLLLDEPTSGLNPGLDKSIMKQMRDLAHDGRTVIVVTHSVANLETCDRLLVLVPGGKVAYYGPPSEALSYFDLPDWADVFQAFEAHPDRDWAAEFATSPAYTQYMRGPGWRPAYRPGEPQPQPTIQPRRHGTVRQISTLARRYVQVISADRGYLLLIGLLPVILGLLIHFVGSSQGLTGFHNNQNAQELLLMLTICACLSGAASSVRELAKERTIYLREQAAGLSSGAYLFSKLIVLGVISIVQSALLVLIGLFGQKLPAHGALPGVPPLLEILAGITVLSLATMCLGLLVSALVSTSEKAILVLVLLTMAQLIFSGGVVSLVGKAGVEQLAYAVPARWGFGAVASTANLNIVGVTAPGSSDPLWVQSAGRWLFNISMLVGLGVLFTLFTWYSMSRLNPSRRRSSRGRA